MDGNTPYYHNFFVFVKNITVNLNIEEKKRNTNGSFFLAQSLYSAPYLSRVLFITHGISNRLIWAVPSGAY